VKWLQNHQLRPKVLLRVQLEKLEKLEVVTKKYTTNPLALNYSKRFLGWPHVTKVEFFWTF